MYHGIALYYHSWYHSLQVPFLKGRVVYTAHECPCGVFDTQALWEDRWSWLLPGTTGSISIWSPARVLSPFPSSTVSTIDHSPCLQPTLKPSRLYVGLIVAAFPACWCSSETFKRSCQNDAKHGHSLPSHFELILWEMDHGQYGHDCSILQRLCYILWILVAHLSSLVFLHLRRGCYCVWSATLVDCSDGWKHSKSFIKHGIQRGRRGVLQRCSGCPCRRSSNAAAEGSGESLLALECSVGTVDKVLGLPCDPMVGFNSLSHLLHLMFHEFLRMFRLVVDFNRSTRVIKLNRPA